VKPREHTVHYEGLEPPPPSWGGRLQLEDDFGFVRRECRAQRIGWGVMAFLIAAGLIGLFGAGPLAVTEVAGRGASLRYERVLRVGRPTPVRVTLPPAPHGSDGVSQLRLELPDAQPPVVQEVFPTPDDVDATTGAVRYRFAPSSEPTGRVIELRLVARSPGLVRVGVACPGCDPLELRALALP
jgi:hypothetical protein